MSDCIHNVIEALRSGTSPDMQERLLEARLLIEKFRDCGGWKGISSAVDVAQVSAENIADLRTSLIEFIRREREHPAVGTAIWALGIFYDESIRNFFKEEMRIHFQAGRYFPVSQADCALEYLDEGTGYSFAPDETGHEKYFEAVRIYLDKHPA